MARTVLPVAARKVWQVAMVVRGGQGFVLGISLLTWGPLLYEQFQQHALPSTAITLTSLFFGLESLLITLLEVPTGAFGDAAGRKWSVIYSFACLAVGNLLLTYMSSASSFATLLCLGFSVVLFFALYYTFFSGSFTAWCIEQLQLTAPDVSYEQILAPAQTANALCKLGGVLLGIGCYVADWAWLGFLIGAIGAVGCLLYCLGEMYEPERSAAHTAPRLTVAQLTTEMGNIIGTALRILYDSRAVTVLVCLFACFLTLENFVGLLWPVYVRTNLPGTPQVLTWLGLAFLTQFAEAGGSHAVTLRARSHGTAVHARHVMLRRLLIGGCVFGGVPVLCLSVGARWQYDPLWLFLIAIICVRIGYGVITPAFETLLNNYLPHSHARERATVLSFGSFINGILILLLAIPTSGPSGEKTTAGWLVPAILLLVVTAVGHRVLRRTEREAPRLQCEMEPHPNLEEKS